MVTSSLFQQQQAAFRRLGASYFLYFGYLGVLVPYLGVFLDGRGFSSVEIGELFAVITLARIFGPSLWAGFADRSGKTLGVLRFGAALTMVSFALVLFAQGFWWLTLSLGLVMMFWTAILPQLEVITMKTVTTAYGRVRLWGSIGFIVLTILAGKALDYFSSEAPIYVCMAVLCGLFLSTLLLRAPDELKQPTTQQQSVWQWARRRPFVVFIASATLLQMSFGTFYGFFALYMRDLGYSGQQTGLLIALGVLAEVFIFLAARKLIARHGVWWLLVVCMAATSMRWFMLAYWADSAWIVVASQVIHALSFGLTHAVSVHFIHQFLPAVCHSRGQALYISIAFGLGGAIGNYVAGQTWQGGLGSELSFAIAGFMALAGTLVLLLTKKADIDSQEPQHA